MKNKAREREKEFVADCEIKQQIVNIIAIIIIFLAAMVCGKVCMDKCGGTWVAFNFPKIRFCSHGFICMVSSKKHIRIP